MNKYKAMRSRHFEYVAWHSCLQYRSSNAAQHTYSLGSLGDEVRLVVPVEPPAVVTVTCTATMWVHIRSKLPNGCPTHKWPFQLQLAQYSLGRRHGVIWVGEYLDLHTTNTSSLSALRAATGTARHRRGSSTIKWAPMSARLSTCSCSLALLPPRPPL